MEQNQNGFNFKELNRKLKIPTPLPLIKQRNAGTDNEGNDVKLNYVEWYNYADALDELCANYWRPEVLSMIHAGNDVCIALRLHIDGFWVDNVGSESLSHSDPIASAYAQAFKRCCGMLGFTRDLYSAGDEKEGKWRFVEKTRQANIVEIKKLLKTKKIRKNELEIISAKINDGTMHYNVSVRTLDHLNNAENKPKPKRKPADADKSKTDD